MTGLLLVFTKAERIAVEAAIVRARTVYGVDLAGIESFAWRPHENGQNSGAYVDADHAVTLHSDRHGRVGLAVARVDFVHDDDVEDCDCDPCGQAAADLDDEGHGE